MPEPIRLTLHGHNCLSEELRRLVIQERPEMTQIVSWAAGNGDRSENGDYLYGKKRLREIDRRIRFLMKTLDGALRVDPASQRHLQAAYFGALVEVLFEDSPQPRFFHIVGAQEISVPPSFQQPEALRVSLDAPVARALLKKEPGAEGSFLAPEGERFFEVLSVSWPD